MGKAIYYLAHNICIHSMGKIIHTYYFMTPGCQRSAYKLYFQIKYDSIRNSGLNYQFSLNNVHKRGLKHHHFFPLETATLATSHNKIQVQLVGIHQTIQVICMFYQMVHYIFTKICIVHTQQNIIVKFSDLCHTVGNSHYINT